MGSQKQQTQNQFVPPNAHQKRQTGSAKRERVVDCCAIFCRFYYTCFGGGQLRWLWMGLCQQLVVFTFSQQQVVLTSVCSCL
ncbi:hypothetical protein L596_024548 [Steinernema carpocapsae]|uniref:Uncharacterized protein n=1 Tax=Steinernema carpocapsae TaxID=34508 RepID=A0A4U5MH33_STECR|nr:hypothetical protein L596_024548 [Steinernema carpocapsae]